ncbi:hypothetical protein [Paractinoplanes atraurantiacus]|uniref:Uncharacterized protein n=1 Tax=Paractinoplanes atraurantiacus TaxID=1036182 RepID=A0A285JYB7_9ACTN|nr:hypothetical protein [Actinoplanes atraurantiacus]SNY65290.1 hypothetical protein SAMN05421748_12819 [Actinoplanes atraurantiacus]
MGVSTAPPATAATAPQSSQVDWLLCSYAWLNPAFGRFVYSTLIQPGLRAVPPTHGVDVVALARHVMAARRHRRLVIVLALVDVLLIVAGAGLILGLGRFTAGDLGWGLAVLLGGVLAYFVLIGWHLGVTRTRASRLAGGPPPHPRDAAARLPDAVEERLDAYAKSNVIVFGGGIPFVGAGKLLTRWNVQVDTTKAAKDDHGRPRAVQPVNAEELQKALSITVRKAGIDGIRVNNRLFVDGTRADAVDGLLPDPEQPPSTTVARSEIRRAILNATVNARTYLCIEVPSWNGELVVTVFVRAVEFGTDLYAEFYAYVLLPLHPVVASAENLPISPYGRAAHLARWTVPTGLRLLRNAPHTLFMTARWRRFLARRPAVQRRIIRKSAFFDYGAVGGIRAAVAAEHRDRLFAYEDEERAIKSIRKAVLKVVVQYVSDHGIDTSELERQQSQIFKQTINIRDVKGRNIMLGDNNKFFDGLAMGGADEDDDGSGGTAGGKTDDDSDDEEKP